MCVPRSSALRYSVVQRCPVNDAPSAPLGGPALGVRGQPLRFNLNAVDPDVQDSGVGIPPEVLGRLFEFGYTTKKDGHGFGLHSAALAAREMGGALRASSDGIGAGACFVLELPLRPTVGDT